MTGDMTDSGASIDLRSISKQYGNFTALDDVSLRVEPGEFISFLGPSGSGKTTTLNLIAGFTDLTLGEIRLGERSIGSVPSHKRDIGVVFQHYALFPHMTVAQNVAFPLKQRRVSKAEAAILVESTLRKVELTAFSHRYPSELSGGQQQRVALARAMVFKPSVLLMDEPLGALDKKLREVLQLEIKRIHRELGSTFVYVTHDQEEALVLSDRIAVFNKGKIEQVGTGHELYSDPRTLFVGQFIGESSILRGPHESVGAETALTVAGRRILARKAISDMSPHVILVRPESVSVHATGTNNSSESVNVLPGTVLEKLYLGSCTKYEVKLNDGSKVTARANQTSSTFDIGQEVEVSWSPEDSKLLADDGTTLT